MVPLCTADFKRKCHRKFANWVSLKLYMMVAYLAETCDNDGSDLNKIHCGLDLTAKSWALPTFTVGLPCHVSMT